MKRALILLVMLALTACAPSLPDLVPVETAVAQTMEAMPKTDTPTPAPSFTPTPTSLALEGTPTPLVIPGAECIPQGAERTRARVTRAIDGDTVEVAIGNSVYLVRYIGIDAPEMSPQIQPMAGEARLQNRQLVEGQLVTLIKDTSDSDSSGRLLRYVVVGDLFVNYELVRLGYAHTMAVPPDLACLEKFLNAEDEARDSQTGVWAPTPVPSATMTSTATPTPRFSPTPTSTPACNCSGPKLTCNSFSQQSVAQACFNYCKSQGLGDIFELDKNNNGKACEGMP